MKVQHILLLAIVAFSSCEKKSNYKAECEVYNMSTLNYTPHSEWYKSDQYNGFTKSDAESRFGSFEDAYHIQYDERVQELVKLNKEPNAYVDCKLSKQ